MCFANGMKIDAPLMTAELAQVPTEARELEALGYDGTYTFEGRSEPFFPLLLGAEHTTRIELATAVAIALPRNPLQLAHVCHDLQVFSRGRFVLGLGSQIKTHIEKRYGATWSKPIAHMRELVLALKAIWRCWNENERLDFRGEFYRHTLMIPTFAPPPSPVGPPRVLMAGVGAPMTAAAAEVADGIIIHPLHSPEFIRQTTLPALHKGFTRSGRTGAEFEIACQAMVITGFTEEEFRLAEQTTRGSVAFYSSTPAYRVVLETHGWGPLQDELNTLSKQGRWAEMSGLIDDRMLDTLTIRCEPKDLPVRLQARYGGLVDRIGISCYHGRPDRGDPAAWKDIIAACKQVPAVHV
ncbi:MAG: putative F420-dependent oxidoreductase, family [Deltaproteobacteria bacterium]|nr:putative F420-dependent oxidoreductase, family [Deltaproteobacteria bacterium]